MGQKMSIFSKINMNTLSIVTSILGGVLGIVGTIAGQIASNQKAMDKTEEVVRNRLTALGFIGEEDNESVQ